MPRLRAHRLLCSHPTHARAHGGHAFDGRRAVVAGVPRGGNIKRAPDRLILPWMRRRGPRGACPVSPGFSWARGLAPHGQAYRRVPYSGRRWQSAQGSRSAPTCSYMRSHVIASHALSRAAGHAPLRRMRARRGRPSRRRLRAWRECGVGVRAPSMPRGWLRRRRDSRRQIAAQGVRPRPRRHAHAGRRGHGGGHPPLR